MALLLSIDTANEIGGVCLADEENVLSYRINREQKAHASFVQVAIQEICKEASLPLSAIDAVAVSNGPGSYTGLRVGLASAKGIAYALQKPLITVNTLEAMALEAIESNFAIDALYCPMIDARRMEVFTAIFDSKLHCVLEQRALILEDNSFAEIIKKNHKIYFFGSGMNKWQGICKHKNIDFVSLEDKNIFYVNKLANKKALHKNFQDIAYVEPNYIKPFFATLNKK